MIPKPYKYILIMINIIVGVLLTNYGWWQADMMSVCMANNFYLLAILLILIHKE